MALYVAGIEDGDRAGKAIHYAEHGLVEGLQAVVLHVGGGEDGGSRRQSHPIHAEHGLVKGFTRWYYTWEEAKIAIRAGKAVRYMQNTSLTKASNVVLHVGRGRRQIAPGAIRYMQNTGLSKASSSGTSCGRRRGRRIAPARLFVTCATRVSRVAGECGTRCASR